MTLEKRAICDLCGATDTYQGEIAPVEWGSLRIMGGTGLYREYHICPMCMPPVKGKKQDWADAGHPDEEKLIEEAKR